MQAGPHVGGLIGATAPLGPGDGDAGGGHPGHAGDAQHLPQLQRISPRSATAAIMARPMLPCRRQFLTGTAGGRADPVDNRSLTGNGGNIQTRFGGDMHHQRSETGPAGPLPSGNTLMAGAAYDVPSRWAAA